MDDVQATINFGGSNPEQGLNEFMLWFTENGGLQQFLEYLEAGGFRLDDGNWTDDSVHLEINEIENEDEDEDEDEDRDGDEGF